MMSYSRLIKYVIILLVMSVASAEIVNFSYVSATKWKDGRLISPGDIRSTRLYCNGVMVDGHAGDKGSFEPDLPAGTYECYSVHSVVNNSSLSCRFPDEVLGDTVCISGPSNIVSRVVGETQFAPETEPPVLK